MPDGIGYGVTQAPPLANSSSAPVKKNEKPPESEPVQRTESLQTESEPPPEETEFLGSNVDYNA
jgi:hypothetical protein